MKITKKEIKLNNGATLVWDEATSLPRFPEINRQVIGQLVAISLGNYIMQAVNAENRGETTWLTKKLNN